MQQINISTKLIFGKLKIEDSDIEKFYLTNLPKFVDEVSDGHFQSLDKFPTQDQIQADKCYLLKIQSNDLQRIARQNTSISICSKLGKKYKEAGMFKYLICNILGLNNIQCRLIKVKEEIKIENEFEKLRDYKFVHFYQLPDQKNPLQNLKNTITYYYQNSTQHSEHLDSQNEESSTITNNIHQTRQKKLNNPKNQQNKLNPTQLRNHVEGNSFNQESKAREQEEEVSNHNLNIVNNSNLDNIQNIQQQQPLLNQAVENQLNPQQAIQNLINIIQQKDLQILDQQYIILQQQMQQVQLRRQTLQNMSKTSINQPILIPSPLDINNQLQNQLNVNKLNIPTNKFDKIQVKQQEEDKIQIIDLED